MRRIAAVGLGVLLGALAWRSATSGEEAPSSPVAVCFTFDDGPKGNVTEVLPVLERHGWRGCFNVVTDLIGRDGYMTWDDVREVRRRGHDVASHSLSHPRLVKLISEGRTNEVRRQIFGSRDVLQRELGEKPEFFCHPFIQTTAEIDALIVEAGMKPMVPFRQLITHKAKPGGRHGVAATIARELAKGDRALPMDILFHGTSPTSGGYEALTGEHDFERMLDEVAEMERAGRIRVVRYGEFHRLFTSR